VVDSRYLFGILCMEKRGIKELLYPFFQEKWLRAPKSSFSDLKTLGPGGEEFTLSLPSFSLGEDLFSFCFFSPLLLYLLFLSLSFFL
jgi:hypothetical protein